jgi:endonuclease/exonuclease/phosphatase family metal-dependent hydrolase
MCLAEVRAEDQTAYRADPRWPHQVWELKPSGIALLSTQPIVEHHLHQDRVNPLIEAIVEVDGRRLRVIAVHTTSPTSPSRQRERARELALIARLATQDDLPTLAMGDFNLSLGDPEWRGFTSASGLLRAAGHEPATWPSPLGPGAIGIDHLLARGCALGPSSAIWLPGSDHRGLTAQLALLPR